MALHDLFVRLTLQDAQFRQGLQRNIKGLDGMAGSVSSLQGIMQGLGIAGFGYLAKQAGEMVWEMGKAGAATLQLADSFDELARQAGGSSDAILAALKRATGGTVANADLILAANRGIMLGLGAQAEQWEQLAEVARFRARAMGISTTQAISDITTGIGRESRMILDNLGIILDTDQVMQQYAASLGTTADKLGQAERKQAILNAVITEGQGQIAAAGGITENYADQIATAEAALKNLTDTINAEVAPAVADMATQFTLLADTVAGPLAEGVGFAVSQLGAYTAELALIDQVLQGNVSATEAWTIALTAQSIQSKLGVGAANAYIAAILGIKEEMRSSTEIDGWMAAQKGLTSNVEGATKAIKDQVAAIQGWRIMVQGAASNAAAFAQQMVGLIPDEAMTGWRIMQEEQERRKYEMIKAAVLHSDAEVKAARTTNDAWKDAYADIRSIVQSALSPTQVTAADMAATEAGEYVEKWDEAARQLDAIAARGFGELAAHPDWAGILKIPPDVLAGNEQMLMDWARNTANAVRGMERPDLLNIDAAVRAVQEEVNRQAAVELSLDMIVEAAIAKGIVGGEGAKAQVAEALGLADPAIGETAAASIMTGFSQALSEGDMVGQFYGRLTEDAAAQSARLESAGVALWGIVAFGIKKAMYSTNWPRELAALISPYVVRMLEEQGYF